MKIKIYGSRGSIPFFNPSRMDFGGNTSCVRIDMDGRIIILDCGTGILQFYFDMLENSRNMGLRLDMLELNGRNMGLRFDMLEHTENMGLRFDMLEHAGNVGLCFDILLSHLHLDHIMGLSSFPLLMDKKNNIRIFTKSRSGCDLASQIFGIFKPPYWPIDLALKNQAELIEINDKDSFRLSESIKVTPFESEHSDGTTAFRIEGEKTVVYLLDYELNIDAEKDKRLINYCKDSDVILFDCTYLSEDYPSKRGWGHSTLESGMALAESSNCKKMILSHFSYEYSDETLRSLVERIPDNKDKYFFAYDGMEMEF